MSIHELIRDRVDRGMLFVIKPRARGTSPRRALFVCEPLWQFLQNTHADDELEERAGFLQADLEVFASGEPIHPKYLFLLFRAAEAVWEIRSTNDDPSIRVLGRFADKNVLVLTNFALRKDLGGWQSRAWRDVKVRARSEWNRALHPYQPIVTTNVHELVTGAIDGKYFKTNQ